MPSRWRDHVLMVIPSVNGEPLLARMLPTVRHTPENIVVLDQGSTDGTAALCARAGVTLVQLGRPHTYTEAGNIGADLARQRNIPFLCLANNDITFRTDVLAHLFAAMQADPALAIVAPSQLVIDPETNDQILSHRVSWDLDHVTFQHDTSPVEPGVQRLESDFCELTCALIRMSAIHETGFLDDAYGFYHEDADLGFRLRNAGYSCAYLPETQIIHFTSSTFAAQPSARKRDYIARNRRLFVARHLGYGISLPPNTPKTPRFTPADHVLPLYLARYGLIDPDAPSLISAPPGIEIDGYLRPLLATDHIPARWAKYAAPNRPILTSGVLTRAILPRTDIQRDSFRALGFPNVHTLPASVETDIFHPWGARLRPHDATTYLAWCDGWQHDALATILEVWRRFAPHQHVRLYLYGHGLSGVLGPASGSTPDLTFDTHSVRITTHDSEAITILDLLAPMPDHEAAHFFRGIDYTLNDPTTETAAFTALQAAACGALPLSDLPDLPPGNTADALLARLHATTDLTAQARAALVTASVNNIRATTTPRRAAMALHRALTHLQIRDPDAALARLERHDHHRVLALEAIDLTTTPGATPPSHRRVGVIAAHRVGVIAANRVGVIAARRLVTLGRLTSQFGAAWQHRGLAAASTDVAAELRKFVTHRSRHATRLLRRPTAPLSLTPTPPKPAFQPPAPLSKNTAQDGPSVLLIGYIDAQLGLGQSLRGLARALATTPIDVRIAPITLGVETRRGPPFMPDRHDSTGTHPINILELTPDELPRVLAHLGPRTAHSYNILRTYWELGQAPAAWRANLAPIHEIWAPNPFVADSLRSIFDGPITIVPPCLDLPHPEPGGHAAFGLDPATFWFLFSFDYFSFPQRKNPLAVLRSFRTAFPTQTPRVGLVLKATGAAAHHPELRHALRTAAAADGRIVILDESLTRQEMLSLLTAADAYVSLHRAEGFGLGMAEAMALGKPVLATAYSGNTDFLHPDTGYPVPYTLIPLEPGDYVHPENQVWAQPDETAAATLMRDIVTNRPEATRRATAGQHLVLHRYGSTNVAEIATTRLQQLRSDAEP